MNDVVRFLLQHGYTILFAAVFGRQIGLPIPANLFLLAAGALVAAGTMAFSKAILVSVIACVLADWIWYEAGRVRGEEVLHFVHRITPDPERANRHAKRTFAKHGPPILVISKFIPGLDFVAPPLAGTSRASRTRFLTFETIGAVLWAGVYGGFGYVFSENLNRAAMYATRTGVFICGAAVVAVVIFLAVTFVRRIRRSAVAEEPDPGYAPVEPIPSQESDEKIFEDHLHRRALSEI